MVRVIRMIRMRSAAGSVFLGAIPYGRARIGALEAQVATPCALEDGTGVGGRTIGSVARVPIARHLLRARDLADAHYSEALGVADMAAAAALSPAHFSRCFKAAFGESPRQYLLTRRLERAAALLLATDWTVAAVGVAVGLRSIGSFTTSFRRMYGMTPQAYRAAHPPTARHVRIPRCVAMTYGRPRNRTFREDAALPPA
jgi:AraC-like DNA-binding protein